MPGWALVMLAIGAAAATSSAGTIYRCAGDDGETVFSDLPCQGGHVHEVRPVTTIALPQLSAEERKTLDGLGRGVTSRSNTAPVFRTNAKTSSHDERRCEAARDGLDQVRAIKRRGYRASTAASLDARQRRYETQRDRDCADP